MSWKNIFILKVEMEFEKLTQVGIFTGDTGSEDMGWLPLPTEEGCSLSGLEPSRLTWKYYHGLDLVDSIWAVFKS